MQLANLARAGQFLSTPSARRATGRQWSWCRNRLYFYPRPPRGGRRGDALHDRIDIAISIHALREEGDCIRPEPAGRQPDFYPRPPRGGRPMALSPAGYKSDFYPRPPRGGRPRGSATLPWPVTFLSTPSARRATYYGRKLGMTERISIHALREEGDMSRFRKALLSTGFLSTPSARRATELSDEEGETLIFLSTPSARRATMGFRSITSSATPFLSTPSARRATGKGGRGGWSTKDFYPRPPRGGRPPAWQCFLWSKYISIHALREEGDELLQVCSALRKKFLSTPSARRATSQLATDGTSKPISIHALREEGDVQRAVADIAVGSISIHALREEGDALRIF